MPLAYSPRELSTVWNRSRVLTDFIPMHGIPATSRRWSTRRAATTGWRSSESWPWPAPCDQEHVRSKIEN